MRNLMTTLALVLALSFVSFADAGPAEAATCEASWYGPGFYGNLTASGEVYTGEAGTAAHPYLPFGTVLYVENLYSGASGYVTITDRGPYYAARCLDFSAGSSYLVNGSVSDVYYEILYYPY